MGAEDEWTSIGVRESTRDKLRQKKREAEADSLSDDSFLSLALDVMDPVKLSLVIRERRPRSG